MAAAGRGSGTGGNGRNAGEKKPARRPVFHTAFADYLAGAGAGAAASAGAGAGAAASAGAAGAAASAGAAGAGAGAATSGAGAGAASSFLPQADRETASRAASRTEYFIEVFPYEVDQHVEEINRHAGSLPTDRVDSSKKIKICYMRDDLLLNRVISWTSDTGGGLSPAPDSGSDRTVAQPRPAPW